MFILDNFVVMDSMYGRFIIPRHYTPGPPTPDPASVMLRTGKTHIEDEVQTILYFISRLPDNAIIVDGGANMGFFTIPVAQAVKEKGSKVISFEPQRQIYYALCGSCALNELENVFVHNLGLGDSQTTAQLSEVDYSDRTDFGMVSISEDVEVKEHKYLSSRTVNVITLDSMDLPSLEFLSLDVEGYECQALRGGLQSIITHRPIIWIEYNMAGEDNIKNELKSVQNYRYIVVDWQNMLCIPEEKCETYGIK